MIIRRWGGNWPSSQMPVNKSALVQTVPPVQEPLTLSEVKRFLRVDTTYEDALILLMISAARQRMEAFLRRALITQTYDLNLDWLPAWVELPYPPLQAVGGVFARQLDQTEVAANPATYFVRPEARIVGLIPSAIWPLHITPFGGRINFTVGYGNDPSSVPAAIKLSMYNMIANSYESRNVIGDIPGNDVSTLQPYRVMGAPWRMAKGIEPGELLA